MRTFFPAPAGLAVAGLLLSLSLTGAPSSSWAQDDEPSARAPAYQASAPDPNEPSKHRLDRLEREVDEVRQIVLQARATGRPVEIKDAGPDPAIADLQTKLDDIETTLRNQTGQIEVMGHDLAGAKQDAADAKAAVAALSDRVDKLEKQLAALTTPPPANEASVPPAEASAAPAAAGDPKAAYAQAKQLMLGGDYPGAAAAFQAYIDQHGDQSNIPTAHYWLGEVKFAQEDYTGAAAALAEALRGWPETNWAPDALVKLSESLTHLSKTDQACAALTELHRRYPRAPAATKARAEAARAQALCAR
jgi:tol-pal system protein YbgF